MQLVETARAKVNLTLRILGKRADGYHELESLVAFADVGDSVRLEAAPRWSLEIVGPFAAALQGHDNLINRVAALVEAATQRPQLYKLTLDKRLPVAAGVGGGSADAAAALRLLRVANGSFGAQVDWMTLAAQLGADVPVCLHNAAAVMRGLGERLEPVADFAPLPAVLVNPQVPVPSNKTAAVFKALAAPPLPQSPRSDTRDFSSHQTNDLERPARSVMPVIDQVLDVLHALPRVRAARLSGAGPTCFALFESEADAQAAARTLADRYPSWWIAPTTLR